MIQQEIEHDIEEDNEKELIQESNNVKNDNDLQIQYIFNDIDTISDSITLFKMQLSELQEQLRNVKKNVKKEFKKMKKEKRAPKSEKKRLPSGFAKPGNISLKLCKFIGVEEGTMVARTDVTKFLIQYIQQNGLQHKETNKNKIVPDAKLKDLLGDIYDENNDLTFFTIQKYMTQHFIKK